MSAVSYSLPDIFTFTSKFVPEIARSVEPSPTPSPSSSPTSQRVAIKTEGELEAKTTREEEAIPDLVSHVSFFDKNKDGVILPWETYETLHSDLGINPLISFGVTAIIHFFMSYPTADTWVPDPFFGITVANISKCRLGSHSGVYDTHGRIDIPTFEEQFGRMELASFFKVPTEDKSSTELKPSLSLSDVWRISASNDSLLDIVGWVVDKVMWTLLSILEDNSISKKKLLECYKGEQYFESKRVSVSS